MRSDWNRDFYRDKRNEEKQRKIEDRIDRWESSNNGFDELLSSSDNNIKVADNELALPSGKIITFNEQQYEAIKKIREFLKSKKSFFTLSGFSGTGKTTCIKKILDEYKRGVVVSAPTHKARKVIEDTTGIEGKTIAALLGLRPDVMIEDFSPNNPIFSPIVPAKITDYNFVIMDESSMINAELFKLIKEKISGSGTKVLFMGDDKQIPPVGEKLSVVFFDPDIELYELTIVERQKDSNPLLYFYDKLRNNLDDIDGGIKNISDINSLGEGVTFTTNKKLFREEVINKFKSEEFTKDSDFIKLIAWKNETVTQSNKIIRDALFDNSNDCVLVNDLLVGYRTITNDKLNYTIIQNSADYHVVERSELLKSDFGLMGYKVKLKEDLPKGKFKYDEIFIIDSNDENTIQLYAQMHDHFRDEAKLDKKLWRNYYTFRRNNILMKDIEKYPNGGYRPTNEIIKRDIDYSYAVTAHKCQGSSYQHVAIVGNDIKSNWIIRERNKIFYVAFSRPKTSAIVLVNRIDE